MKRLTAALLLSTLLTSPLMAETIRWARVADAPSLDPHANNQSIATNVLHHIYETLVETDETGTFLPRLATEWFVKPDNPNVWVFRIREGVTFHDGSALTADDVVFSLDRARSAESQFRGLHASVVAVTAVDDHTVEVELAGPSAIYPNNLTNTFIMDRGWAETHDAVTVQDAAARTSNHAVRNTNGTGPYILDEREQDVRTVMVLNPNHWAAEPPQVTRIEFFTIADPATRSAALISGEVDLILDLPVQDIPRLSATEGISVVTGPENRVIYFSYRIAGPLQHAGAGQETPFADPRVREAVELAIDRDAISTVIMRGQSIPTDVVAPPFAHGYTPELAEYPRPDLARARALLAEAGYPDGFEITLDTPNNRYINDEAISQAAVAMLGQIGIRARLESRPMAQHTPIVLSGESDFYLLGWGVPTFDTAYTFGGLFHSRTGAYGVFNTGGYANPELDALIEAIDVEIDIPARDAMIAQAWEIIQTDRPVLALHNQVLAYAMRQGVNVAVDPGDQPRMDRVTFD